MMYFIHIATMSDGKDFVGFLDGENKRAFNDSHEFHEWLAGQEIFPLSIYVDGATYEFGNKDELLFFRLGFETAIGLLGSK